MEKDAIQKELANDVDSVRTYVQVNASGVGLTTNDIGHSKLRIPRICRTKESVAQSNKRKHRCGVVLTTNDMGHGKPMDPRICRTKEKTSMLASCSCMRIESFGIPCKHIVCVLVHEDIDELPRSLVLPRWT
ncbi:hypothetical protein Ahy_A10g048374 [Arachis hypogaea]|uniref:SWIM-type domain-containing protein n=1 Tax=Arachis hypogaea TaxID=3818 RepID=A0A445B543_ARAHY|nr:hypothetical protein Ahy_A10g048374 [Arachis hypogaea]